MHRAGVAPAAVQLLPARRVPGGAAPGGVRMDAGGGASGGRREAPDRQNPALSPSAESRQVLPAALDHSLSAVGAGCAAIGLGAGPRAPGLTR